MFQASVEIFLSLYLTKFSLHEQKTDLVDGVPKGFVSIAVGLQDVI